MAATLPDRGSALLACEKVPPRYRRLYALSVYLYTRPGELAPLEWSGVEFPARVRARPPSARPLEDLAANLRVHLQRAEVMRADLYPDDRTTKRVTFYDLRATGITWEIVAGTEKAVVQQRAGHLHSTTTDGYIRTAEELGVAVGVPFPALPAALYQPAKRKFIRPRLAHRLRRSRHPPR